MLEIPVEPLHRGMNARFIAGFCRRFDRLRSLPRFPRTDIGRAPLHVMRRSLDGAQIMGGHGPTHLVHSLGIIAEKQVDDFTERLAFTADAAQKVRRVEYRFLRYRGCNDDAQPLWIL